MVIAGYVLSILVSYLLFRLYYKNDKSAWANPHILNIFVMLVPIVNLGVPLLLYLLTIMNNTKIEFNYKKFFLLKQEKDKL